MQHGPREMGIWTPVDPDRIWQTGVMGSNGWFPRVGCWFPFLSLDVTRPRTPSLVPINRHSPQPQLPRLRGNPLREQVTPFCCSYSPRWHSMFVRGIFIA